MGLALASLIDTLWLSARHYHAQTCRQSKCWSIFSIPTPEWWVDRTL